MLQTADSAPCKSPAVPPPSATHFAPAGRDSTPDFARKAHLLDAVPILRQAIDAMPGMVLVLNQNRQIVTANAGALSGMNAAIADVAEKRPGEAVRCIRAQEGPDGCGTARHCMTCGAVGAVLASQRDLTTTTRECRILAETDGSIRPMDLKVTASPFAIGRERFILVVIEDISQSKRLAVLQRTFFHDVLNTAGCIRGYAEHLAVEGGSDLETCQRLSALSGQLIEAIQAQRDLTHAETGDLELKLGTIHVPAALDELRMQYRRHPAAAGRQVLIGEAWEGTVQSDRQLLLRALGNMLKNALEAGAGNGTVTIGCRQHDGEAEFYIHNPEVIPEEIQLQIFQRSFSTKGQSGRGIGTYSVKLLGERYLGGKVAFTSQEPDGTTFTLAIPLIFARSD